MGVRREWKSNRAFVAPCYPPPRQTFVPADTRLTADHSRRKVAASEGCRRIDVEIHMFLAVPVVFRHNREGIDAPGADSKITSVTVRLNAIVARTIKQ